MSSVEIVETIRRRVDQSAAAIDRNVRPTGPFVTQAQREDAVELALAWVHVADEVRAGAAARLAMADEIEAACLADLAKKIARDTAEAAEVRAGAAARLAMADEIEAACLADREGQDA